MFIIGLVLGIIVTLVAVVIILPKQMFVVKESKLGFAETVAAIEQSAADNQWGISHKYDLQATLKGKGYDVKPVNVMSLCKPDHANQILSSNEERLASALMPCRIAVYENDGKTYVSMLNSALFSKFMSSKIKSVMGEAAAENAIILNPVVKN